MKHLRRITIVHTNDYHGQLRPLITPEHTLGGAPQRGGLIQQLRKGEEDHTIVVDAGDMAEGSLASKMTKGKVVMQEMNEESYALAVPGNHDFDWGIQALKEMADTAKFPLLASNIADSSGNPVPWIKPYIIKKISGLKTAFVGVTTPVSQRFLPEEEKNLLIFMSPYKCLKKTIQQAKQEGADLVVIVSHLGINEDRAMAKKFPGIPIVGGHSHTVLPNGEKVGKSMIVQAGSHGEYVGKLELLVNNKGEVVQSSDKLFCVDTGKIPPDQKVQKIIKEPLQEEEKSFKEIVGSSVYPLTVKYRDTTNFSEILADSLRETTGAPYAMVTNFGVSQALEAGPISVGNLNDVVPWDEKIVTIEITGSKLKKTLEYSFRDSSHAVLVPSGFSYEYDWSKPLGNRITNIMVGNEPISPGKTYSLAINAHDMKSITPLSDYAGKKQNFGLMRDALQNYIQKHSPLQRAASDGRMKNIQQGANT